MTREEFKVKSVTINGRLINKVIIDFHVTKHKDVTNKLILELVKKLNESENKTEDIKGNFEYYFNFLFFQSKKYKLVWLLEKNKSYIGVITTFRDNRSI